jgi:hypothetical protein
MEVFIVPQRVNQQFLSQYPQSCMNLMFFYVLLFIYMDLALFYLVMPIDMEGYPY